MTESITASDLLQYGNLRSHLRDLFIKIKNGKREVQDGTNDFNTYYNELFPDTSTPYNSNSQLSCSTKGLTTMDMKTISLKNLLHNTLYPTFHQTINSGPVDNYRKILNGHIGSTTKDHLCFIKLNADSSDIEPDEESITNILYSKYVIEIFIKIVQALNNCYHNYGKQLISLFSSTTNIFIVDRKLMKDDEEGVPKGIFIDNASVDADSPLIGIYLYIGDLTKMFHKDDLVLYEANATTDTPVSDSVKNTYLDSSTDKYIFRSNNKLQYTADGKYYFGFLYYMNNYDRESVYRKQTGSTTSYEKNNVIGTMTNMTLEKAKITGIITNASVSNLKILKNSRIRKVTGIAKTYEIVSGKINCNVQSGFTLQKDSTIDIDSIKNVLVTANSAFTPTSVSESGNKSNNTVLNTKNIPQISQNVNISESISLLNNSVPDGFRFTTDSDIQFSTSEYTLTDNQDANNVTNISISISGAIISSPNVVSITGNFDKIAVVSETLKSYYNQNIYYIYNFLKMINNIDNNSFSTILEYLEVNLICFKALLLSSIRAANIFYNNKHTISALAISYEENFLNKATATAGNDASCANLELNDFIKNKYTAKFNSTCSSTAKLPEDTTVSNKKYLYILYKKAVAGTDNATIFKDCDERIQKEVYKIINSSVSSSASNVGIVNYQLSHSFKVKSSFNISTNNDNSNDHLSGIFEKDTPPSDYNKIMSMFNNNKKHDFNKNYRIKIGGTTFKALKFTIINDDNKNKRIDIELEQSKDIPANLFNELNKESGATPIQKPIYIVKITSSDIDKDYNNIVSNTDGVEQNINMYKTKIKNSATLYELHKSRNNLLYNQLISYIIIVAVLISVLVIINVANVEKPLIKSITLGCFAVIIILFMAYYIMNSVYIEENFVESGNTFIGYELCPANSCKKSDGTPSTDTNIEQEYSQNILTNKKNYVKAFLDTNAREIMLMIILKSPSIVNDSLKGNNEKLVSISKNIYNEKLYLNDVLYSKKSDSEMNVDVLKYENKNYDVYIICVLFLALIMIGSYTANIYTDNKYLDLLILIMVILFVCLFTYFILYTNRIVRTVSTNYYWGNEYEEEYI
jgi:hypothetical protein